MASPNIAFSTLPPSIRKPGKYFEFNTSNAVNTLPNAPQLVALIAQMTASGTATALTPIAVFSDTQASGYFGRGSIAHLAVRAMLKANPYVQLTVVPVADAGGGVAATKTVTMAGTATATGVLTLLIADQTVNLTVNSGDLASAVATNLNTLLGTLGDLPVIATVLTSVVTLTAKNKGTLGTAIAVSATCTATGITATVAAGTAGATDPVLSTALTPIFTAGHTIICSTLNDATNLALLVTHLNNVSSAIEQRGCIGIYGYTGTLATSITLALGINSGRISGILVPSTISTSWQVAAAYTAVVAGEPDVARPLNTLPLTGIIPQPQANWLMRTEQESALWNGVTPTEVGPGNLVQIVRAITTYTLDPQGVQDISLLDLTTIKTLDYVRLACRTRIALRFPREKKSQKTLNAIRSELLSVLYLLQDLQIVENVDLWKAGLIVENDIQDPTRADAKIPCDIINGLHVFAARIDLILN